LQLLLGRAEVKELRQQLADQEEVADKLRVRFVGCPLAALGMWMETIALHRCQ
jgi:hypothetical protein